MAIMPQRADYDQLSAGTTMTATTNEWMANCTATLPIVFAGLSITPAEAEQYLHGDYRPPIRRGDLEQAPHGAVVLILDGVFDRTLAVSPGEILGALARGVRIFGAASMGALRAAEVPGIRGIGRIHQLYASGEIVDDDEVAVLVDPRGYRPLSVPMVNIRHAVARLAVTGTIDRDLGRRIVAEAKALPYALRVWRDILAAAGVADPSQAAQLESLLRAIDLKREDAITALEVVARLSGTEAAPSSIEAAAAPLGDSCTVARNEVHLWEFDSPAAFGEIVDFLACTGRLADVAERAVMLLPPERRGADAQAVSHAAERLLEQAARAWHWVTEEEVSTSMADLALDATALERVVVARADMRASAQALVAARDPEMMAALRHLLFLDDLALKREAARLLSLRWLATHQGKTSPTAAEIAAVKTSQCRWLDLRDAPAVTAELQAWGVAQGERRTFVEQIALARRKPAAQEIASCDPAHPWLASVPKVEGRFCTPLASAIETIERIRPRLGITRLAMITGLGPLGIPVAQAFRPDGEWSSTVGSGKSASDAGARIGAVMEEVEKWSQERFSAEHERHCFHRGSYRQAQAEYPRVADPAGFDLPFDSAYDAESPIDWYEATDLLSGQPLLVPASAFTHRRLPGDIYYSPHGARKTVTTNGLAAGMTMQEALVHAICEFVERHARTMTGVADDNPGTLHARQPTFIDLDRVPPPIEALVAKIRAAGFRIVARDIRRDIDIPVVAATILIPNGLLAGGLFGDGWQRAGGWACFPDPAVALEMAILEACQTVLSHIAGAREDLAIHARSLGRHERTDACRAAGHHADFDPDSPRLPLQLCTGWRSDDLGSDLRWLLGRLAATGCRHVAAIDFSRPEIAPVRAVRVVIPGLETINAFHTGPRARRALVADLLGQ